MPKNIATDLIAILRKFNVADELSTSKAIKDVKQYPERMRSRLIRLVFQRNKYYVLFDTSKEDDAHYILEQIQLDEPNVLGEAVVNPNWGVRSYGMPFKGKDVYLFRVTSSKVRLDLELARRYPSLSRSTVQKYIKAGYVKVRGEVVTQNKYDVTENDDIAMVIPENDSYSASELPILYIDDNVIAVNKPAGVLTHSKGVMNDEFTVAEFFRRYTTNALETNRPGIVHRLDRDTSGVIIGARTDAAATLLKKQFADRKTKKEYVAVVEGVPKTEKAVIDLPIGRNPSAPSTFRVDPSGKPAMTTYEVIATNEHRSLVKLWPKTGRTHQLRVHLQYINTPIVGDRIYGTKKKADRLYLHAKSLEVTIPVSQRQVFTAPLPKEFLSGFPEVKNA